MVGTSAPRRPAGMIRGLVRAAALTIGLVGCGPGQRSDVPLVPVRGTVTLDGKPLAGAALEFIPEGDTPGQGGTGRTSEGGAYSLMTPFGEPGAPAGRYRVVIQKYEAPPGLTASGPPDPNLPPIDSPYRPVLPPEYADPSLTPLTATVSSGGTAAVDFALKSARKAKR